MKVGGGKYSNDQYHSVSIILNISQDSKYDSNETSILCLIQIYHQIHTGYNQSIGSVPYNC